MRWPFHYEHYSRVVWCVLNQKTYHLNHWALLYISGTIQCYKKHVMQYGLWPTASLWRQSWHGIIKNAYNTKTIRSLTAVYKNMFRFRNYCSNYPIMAHMTSIVHHLLSFEEQLIFFIVHVCRTRGEGGGGLRFTDVDDSWGTSCGVCEDTGVPSSASNLNAMLKGIKFSRTYKVDCGRPCDAKRKSCNN